MQSVQSFAVGLWRVFPLLPLWLCFIPVARAEPLPEQQWQSLQRSLAESTEHANYWQYGWGAFHATLTAANAYQASEADDPEDRYDARVNAVTSVLGLLDLILHPLPHSQVQAEVRHLYDNRHDNPEALRRAREQFERAARAETERRQWQSAVGALVVNLAAGLVIGVGDDRPDDGAIAFASGMLITGLKIWTLPDEASSAWHGYRSVRTGFGGTAFKMDYAFHLGPQKVAFEIRF